MKILTANQIKDWDAYTIAQEPVSSIELMERAATLFTKRLIRNWSGRKKASIVIGMGNNGGDGLVIARKLLKKEWEVEVIAVRFTTKHTEDFGVNEHRWTKLGGKLIDLYEGDALPEIDPESVIVDALFGYGLNRGVTSWIGEIILQINQLENQVMSVDMPSGLFADDSQNNMGAVVQSDWVGTFQAPKLSLLMPENSHYVSKFEVIDIGLKKEYLNDQVADIKDFFVDKNFIKNIPVSRKKYDHKGTYGHALLIGGSKGKIGAMVLATKACMRSGAGLTTAYVPACGYSIVQTSIPEAMCIVDDTVDIHAYAKDLNLEQYNAVGIGPGLGTHPDTQNMFLELIARIKRPMVFDADALNILAKHPEWINKLPGGSILTPHPKEFERLTAGKKWLNDFQRLDVLKEMADKIGQTIILKGAHTVVATPEGELYFNSTGNPGMAKGGSGDALTGIITSLLTQGYLPTDAAVLGVYLHGLAGDLAARRVGIQSMLTSDLIAQVGRAWDRCF